MDEMIDLLKEGLTEVVEYQEGKKKLKTHEVYIPDPPKNYRPKDIRRIRRKLHYSQKHFALFLNVSPRTVQSWEGGNRHPNHAALRLLEVIDRGMVLPTNL